MQSGFVVACHIASSDVRGACRVGIWGYVLDERGPIVDQLDDLFKMLA